ncbi:hypothetical protein [Cellulomonas wangsupingiae]|uniref:SAF domain-containing protein n=1 Tax=Cellulomonas wangsupingiae TaxID=2968085 RepID=A0ABY5K0K4_9CELL|nr:hypothetical protein [Cellulomonas wangsupingiae]MCC2335638.1 hypothetical protein [Cellulomonas wangsupingiae]MCM0640269.1 hypothetical protein [Cellulomonas wangsupingiae]UUI63875.1 hypothetical protein NP075_12110 [Cellulomonas wangsupingiae]
MDTSVLDLPAPTAARLRRPGWRDPRLLVGIALIAASVVLGSWVVTTSQRTVPVYVARDVLVPGTSLTSAALVVADVRLADRADGYLRADAPLPEAAVVLRAVGAGELVPAAAVGRADELDVRAVPVPLSGPASSGLVAGARVDLWFTPESGDATDRGAAPGEATPRELAAALTVAEVSGADGAFASGGTRTVHVLVPVDDLPDVLGALAGNGTVDVVPVPGA